MKRTSTSTTLTACILTVLILLPFISSSLSNTPNTKASRALPAGIGQPVSATARSRTVLRTFAPFWRIGDGYSSTLIVRNIATRSSLSATPIVFTANNNQLQLPTIRLAPSEVKKIPLEQALQTAGSSAKSGALALQMDGSQPPTIIGEMVITDYQHGVIFDLPLHAGYANDDAKELHAVWWLPDVKTQGTVVLFNASDKRISVRPSVTINFAQHAFPRVTLAAHETKKLDLRELVQQSGHLDAEIGSISLGYEGPAHALLPALLLANEKTGFSLTGKFFVKRAEQPTLQANQDSVTWHYPAVFSGKADTALGFQKGSKLTPYALISNDTDRVVASQLDASFTTNDGSTQSVSLPINPLLPRETRLIDLTELTKELIPKNVGWFSLRLSHSGREGDLALQLSSVDQKKDFVFTAEGTTQPQGRLDSLYWNVDDDLQAMLVVQNTGGSTVQAQATLSYDTSDGGQGTYKLPLMELSPRATRILNLKQIIASGQPDEAGRVIPANTSLGSATIQVTGGQDSEVLAGGSVTFDPDTGRCGGDMLPICDNPEHPRDPDLCDIIPIIITVCEVLCNPDPLHLSSISPAASAVGHPVHVTLTGTGFDSGASINVGSGVTVSEVTVSSSTTMSADFAVDANASAGNRDVTVTVNGQQSNSQTFSVQVPDRLRVVTDTGNLAFPSCPNVVFRLITYQVSDSSGAHSAIAQAIWVEESFLNQTTNTCGNGQPLASSCELTNSGGQFTDGIAVTPNCGSVALANCNSNAFCGYEHTQIWGTCSQDGGIELTSVAGITHCNEIRVNNSTGFGPGTLLPK